MKSVLGEGDPLPAYGPNLAESGSGAQLSTSNQGNSPATGRGAGRQISYRYRVRDDGRTGYVEPVGCVFWLDEPGQPAWLQVRWPHEQRINEIVLHLPILILLNESQRTLGSVSVEYLDLGTGRWQLVEPRNDQPNPILNFTAPTSADGSESRHMSFHPLNTTQIRVRFNDGNSDGWCFLDQVEVFWTQPAVRPFTLNVPKSPAPGTVIRPGDSHGLQAMVTDAEGRAVAGETVSVETGQCATSDRSGRACLRIETSPTGGEATFHVTNPAGTSSPFTLVAQPVDRALVTALDWLDAAATGLVHGSRMTAFDGTVMYTPDGVASYAGFWVRDFAYMVEGHAKAVPIDDLSRGFTYLISRQRHDGAMPNKVKVDGQPVYCPGDGCDGTFGPNPPPDNPSFMVKLAFRYWELTGDISLFERYRGQLIRGLEFVPVSRQSGLVHIDPSQPSSPYGFTDAIAKTGDQLFDSLLLQEASTDLAIMLMATGDLVEARHWTRRAAKLERDLQSLYDPATGMFLAASADCRQVDIWGSAYAVYLGVASPSQRESVARYLVDHYDGIVVRGQVRHTAPGEYWQRTIVPNRDVYQDGAYWALPAGWVAAAIDQIDHDLARSMMVDLVCDFQANGINEAVNPAIGYLAVPDYVASAVSVLPALRALSR